MKKKEKKAKKKLRAGIFTALMIPILIVLLVIPTVVTSMTSQFDLVLRDVVGEQKVKEDKLAEKLGVDATYYTRDITDSAELQKMEQEYTRKAGSEGFVLLANSDDANKGLPLAKENKVSLFSSSSIDLLAGGTGSGVSTMSSDMRTALIEQGFEINEDLWNFYTENSDKYKRGAGSIMYGGAEDWSVNECPLADISETAKSAANGTTPIFFISRTGGEGRDLARYMGNWTGNEADKDKHYLEPTSTELEIISWLNDNFDNVIIVLNTNNAFELGWVEDYANITSVLWAPGAGGDTCRSIADVLSGTVCPSGHLVDTFAYDAFSSPAMQNMGDIMLTSGGQDVEAASFYDEGIYVGYRYYETRYFDKMAEMGNAGDYDYASTVQFPFGYGLSYTSFEWSNFMMSAPDKDGNIDISVSVKNTGDVAGREVVQVYLNAPYTDYDKENHVEKSAVSLVGFGKTGELNPGASEVVTITTNISDFVTYDDVKAKTYILEAGDYLLTAAKNAHLAANNVLAYENIDTDSIYGEADASFVGAWTYDYADNAGVDNVSYAKSNNGTDITNQFDDAVKDEFTSRDKFLTRNDWEGTFPVSHGTQDNKRPSGYSEKNGFTWELEISDDIKAALVARGVEAAKNPISEEEAATMAGEFGKEGNEELIDYRGRDFDEVEAEGGWDKLIDQMTKEDVKNIIRNAGYQTKASHEIEKPVAVDFDGPSGLNEGGVTHSPYSITYPCATNLAASWNKENAMLHGYYVGEDALAADGNWGKHNYTGIISGWYAPAMNIHRTPFAGRNFEYYSEDGFLSGALAKETVTACADKGVYAYIKHLALNDQEDHRSHVATFSNEQAIREIYLKPFQMCIEETGTQDIIVQRYDEATNTYTKEVAQIPTQMAVMTSYNRIGCTWAGGNYQLITKVLREEWGFNGSVITDYDNGGAMDTEQSLRAGGDLKLTAMGSDAELDIENPASQYFARQALKHVLYTTVNSNAMNGMIHGSKVPNKPFANYYFILIALWVINGLLCFLIIRSIVRRWKNQKAAKITVA